MFATETHITEHHYFRIKNKELGEVYFVMCLRSFILSLVGIFIPIYLYTANYNVQKIALFYLVMFFAQSLLQYPAALIISRYGPKHSIALSLPVLVFHFWQFWTLSQYNWPLWSVAITGSITLALFWQAYHYDFSKAKNKKKAAKQVGRLYIIIAILGAVAPFLGGFIATKYGFNFLFGFVTFMLLFGIFPLFKTGDKHEKRKFNLKKIKNENYLIRQLISISASGVEASTVMTFWPLFVYLILGNYEKLGLVTSAALVLTVFTTYYVGSRGDKVDKCRYIKVGSFLTGSLHILRGISTTIFQVFGFNLLTSFAHSIFLSPLITEHYLHADENSRLEYIYLSEVAMEALRAVYFGIIYLVGFYIPERQLLLFALILGGVITYLIGLMPNASCELRIINRKIKVASKLQKAKL